MLEKRLLGMNDFIKIWHFNSHIHCVKKCPYSQFFWSIFSRSRTKYGEIQIISPYSVQMQENTDQKISEHEHFLRSGCIFQAITCMSKLLTTRQMIQQI